jgi:DNA-directed RNA polymerase specialized sigma24 family protein
MTTIALNCCNSFFKYEMPKRLGTTHFNEFDNNSDDDATGLKEEFIVDPSRNDPEDIVGDRELICLLEKFLESASPSTRQGFELCFDNQLNDMQYQELADAHCVPVGTVRSRMFRFRAHAASYILKATGDLTDGSESAPSGAPVLKQRRDDRWQQKPNAPHKKVPKTSPEPQ